MRQAIAIAVIFLLPLNLWVRQTIWNNLSAEQQAQASPQFKAYIAGMTLEDFELFSSVVEAESDRSDSMDGKTLIALTIFNRVNAENYPNTIRGVITQGGQFQVYGEGTYKSTGRTETSDASVIVASFWQYEEDHPNVIYFNSIGYNYLGTPYAYVDGNYFETA